MMHSFITSAKPLNLLSDMRQCKRIVTVRRMIYLASHLTVKMDFEQALSL